MTWKDKVVADWDVTDVSMWLTMLVEQNLKPFHKSKSSKLTTEWIRQATDTVMKNALLTLSRVGCNVPTAADAWTVNIDLDKGTVFVVPTEKNEEKSQKENPWEERIKLLTEED